MPKGSGFTGWKKKNIKHYVLLINNRFKVAEARIRRSGRKWVAKVDVNFDYLQHKAESSFSTFEDALKWMNKQRKMVSGKVFE